jgi:heme-degrading monooxygenase HmoA
MQNVVVIFSSPDFNANDFDEVWNDLRAAGQSSPKGLISHVGFAKPEGGWMVVDVWESADAFNEFGKTLVPIIQKRGKNVPAPQVIPAHYVWLPQHETMHA